MSDSKGLKIIGCILFAAFCNLCFTNSSQNIDDQYEGVKYCQACHNVTSELLFITDIKSNEVHYTTTPGHKSALLEFSNTATTKTANAKGIDLNLVKDYINKL